MTRQPRPHGVRGLRLGDEQGGLEAGEQPRRMPYQGAPGADHAARPRKAHR